MSEVLFIVLAQSESAPPMVEKLRYLVPESILFIAASVIAMFLGLSPKQEVRKTCAWVAGLALAAAGVAAQFTPAPPHALLPNLMPFAKSLIAAVGVLLVMLASGTVDREYEEMLRRRGGTWDGLRSNRGEFYAFFLFSLMGLMLCASADDLIWLFLALELTSLPTYVMVSISTGRAKSQEAGVKYFFLGALGAAMFLYGFALLYGATGTTQLFGTSAEPGIAQVLAAKTASTGGIGVLATCGLVIAMVGVSFKIAAVPMHFYAPDVYQGAATSVAAFLAFVPKAAGFITLMLLACTVGWRFGDHGGSLPEAIRITLWVMAALTMTVGNVLAILQSNVKRMLAYSSVAHSGYMLVGIIAGPGAIGAQAGSNGLAAVLFYLLCYGFMNLGAFAVLACLERQRSTDGGAATEEIETVDDLRGLWKSDRLLGGVMVLCAASLLGLPPLLGFWGKLYLFTSAISAGELALVVVMGLNSAIAAFYYLRLVAVPLLENPDEKRGRLQVTPFPGRIFAGVLSAASVVLLVVVAGRLIDAGARAAVFAAPESAARADASPAPEDR